MQTGIKFKSCNCGSAEQHNRRDAAYMKAVENKVGPNGMYVWSEDSSANVRWRSDDDRYAGKSLPQVLDDMRTEVKAKTGRSLQEQDRIRKDAKTGKMKVISGSSPIREGCPPIKPDTKIEDFDLFRRWLESKGIHVISIDLHHDEGHIQRKDTEDHAAGEKIYNHHAHIIVDWLDHSTGKSVKLSRKDCQDMQTVLAQSLGMERGTPKEDTGRDGVSAAEYREQKAWESAHEAEGRVSEAEAKLADLNQELTALDTQLKQAQKSWRAQNTILGNLQLRIAGMEVTAAEHDELLQKVEARKQSLATVDAKVKELEKQIAVKQAEIAKVKDAVKPYTPIGQIRIESINLADPPLNPLKHSEWRTQEEQRIRDIQKRNIQTVATTIQSEAKSQVEASLIKAREEVAADMTRLRSQNRQLLLQSKQQGALLRLASEPDWRFMSDLRFASNDSGWWLLGKYCGRDFHSNIGQFDHAKLLDGLTLDPAFLFTQADAGQDGGVFRAAVCAAFEAMCAQSTGSSGGGGSSSGLDWRDRDKDKWEDMFAKAHAQVRGKRSRGRGQ